MTRALAVLTLAELVFAGCFTLSPELPPRPWATIPVETSAGYVVVESRCPELDLSRVQAGLEAAWERGIAEEPRVQDLGWSGLHFVYDPVVQGDDSRAYYDHLTGGVHVACGTYDAISHYPGHHWCLVLGRDCCGTVWHEGHSNGRDLRCERVADIYRGGP